MNVRTMLTKLVSLVTFNMHKTRQQAVLACVHSLANGSAGTVTSIGRGIRSTAYEKHRIKRADRLLSNQALRQDIPALYTAISHLFCHAKHPVIAIDWSDLDDHKGHFLLRAAMTLKEINREINRVISKLNVCIRHRNKQGQIQIRINRVRSKLNVCIRHRIE